MDFSLLQFFFTFAAHWRGSSVGKSAGFITLRSWVQLPSSLQNSSIKRIIAKKSPISMCIIFK